MRVQTAPFRRSHVWPPKSQRQQRSRSKHVVYPIQQSGQEKKTHHSRSLYIIVKNTCKNKLTAFTMTANKYNQASPDIMKGR